MTTFTSPDQPLRSDSGPVGFQIRDAVGLTDDNQTEELWKTTLDALSQRGLDIRRRIDRGGYGVIYQARDRQTAQPRAVKVLIDPASATARATFDRECRILSSQELPGVQDEQLMVAPRFFFAESPQHAQPFLVIEWITGQNLENYVTARPSMPMTQRQALCERIFAVYHALHKANLLHRDVSPRNIMIQGARVRLIDFGSACRKEVGYRSLNSLSTVPITRAFASDDLAAGDTRGDEAHEVHAITKCCFFVLTGQRPDKVDPAKWQAALTSAGVHKDLINIILPRMNQPR